MIDYTPDFTRKATKMNRSELIKNHMDEKKISDIAHSEKLKLKRIIEKEKEAAVRKIVETYKGTFVWTNGYVYKFQSSGIEFSICDQDSRIVGSSHIIPETEEDIHFLENEAHFAFHGFTSGGYNPLKEAFKYKEICMDVELCTGVRNLLKGK